MTGALLVLLSLILAGVGIVLVEAIKLIMDREYGAWAPAFARGFTALAGAVHRSRAAEWRADLEFIQRVDGESGLGLAIINLMAAPTLRARELWRRTIDAEPDRHDPDVDMPPQHTGSVIPLAAVAWWAYRSDNGADSFDMIETLEFFAADLTGDRPRLVTLAPVTDRGRGVAIECDHGQFLCLPEGGLSRRHLQLEHEGCRLLVLDGKAFDALVLVIMNAACFTACARGPRDSDWVGVEFDHSYYASHRAWNWSRERPLDLVTASFAIRAFADHLSAGPITGHVYSVGA